MTSFSFFSQEARSGILPHLYKRVNGFPPYDDILELIKAGERPIAYIGDYSDLSLSLPAQDICDIYIIPETFYPSGHAVALPEDSPFTSHFSRM